MKNENVVFVNGDFISSAEAKVSIFDSGYFYGDGIYEVLLLKDRKIIQVEHHLERLKWVCEKVSFEYKGNEYFINLIKNLIANNPSIQTAMIYIQITRGIKENRYESFLQMTNNIITAYLKEVDIDYEKCKNKALSALMISDNRRLNGDIKMTSLLPSVLARIQAEKENYDYVIFKSRETKAILEGITSNLFIVNENNEILTHPLNHELLHGCVRHVLIKEFKKIGLIVKEIPFFEEDLFKAREVFITGSIKLVNAITNVNGKQIADGKIGEKTKLAIDLYKHIIESSPKV